MLVWCPPSSSLDRDSTWGYLGRHGVGVKRLWLAYTLITASAVVGTWTWIIMHANATLLALAALIVFLAGAIVWPIGILCGSMRTAQLGVFKAAAGSVLLLVFIITETDAPVLVICAAVQIVIHHCVVDGLWAILTPKGLFMLLETTLQ
jgi:ABC-type Na+ efflux pump permease subunit